MNWFRVYIDARNDAKLRTLTDAEHRVWFHLLCYAAEQPTRGTIEGVTGVTGVTDVTSALLLAIEVSNGDTALLTKTVEKLVNLRILSLDDEGLSFINFNKRQYEKPSDMPEKTRERKAAQRERERAQAPDNNEKESVTGVTPRDVTTRTEQRRAEENKENNGDVPDGTDDAKPFEVIDGGIKPKPKPKYSAEFESFWLAYPSGHGNKARSYEQWRRIKPDADLRRDIMNGLEAWKRTDRWHNGYVKAAEVWLRDSWWEDDPPAAMETETDSLSVRPGATEEELRASMRASIRMMG
jgi:hypothetical protein